MPGTELKLLKGLVNPNKELCHQSMLLSVACDIPKTLGSGFPDPGLITCNVKIHQSSRKKKSKKEKIF